MTPVDWTTRNAFNKDLKHYLFGERIAVHCDTLGDGNNVCIFENANDLFGVQGYLEKEYNDRYTVTVVPLTHPNQYTAQRRLR